MSKRTIKVEPDVHKAVKETAEQLNITMNEAAEQLIDENNELSVEEVVSAEARRHERIEETKNTAVGIVGALEETEMVDDVQELARDLAEILTEQNMLGENQTAMKYLVEAARDPEREVTEFDRLLAEIIIQTERGRDEPESPAAEIISGVFGEGTNREVERTSSISTSEEHTASTESNESDEAEQEIPTATIKQVRNYD